MTVIASRPRAWKRTDNTQHNRTFRSRPANVRFRPIADIRPRCHAHSMSKAYRRNILAAVSACAFALAGCAEGWKASEADSRSWLPEAFPHLQRVIVLLRTCQPKRPSGYNNIWVDGSNDDENPHCTFGNDSGIEDIRSELKQAGVLGVTYLPSGNTSTRVNWAEFILFREGIVTSGSTTSVTYKAQPQPCDGKKEGDQSFRVTVRPIAPAPCRWFWQRSEG